LKGCGFGLERNGITGKALHQQIDSSGSFDDKAEPLFDAGIPRHSRVFEKQLRVRSDRARGCS
jgi:hypothetical protein